MGIWVLYFIGVFFVKYEIYIFIYVKVIDKVKVLVDRRIDGRFRYNKKYIFWKFCL